MVLRKLERAYISARRGGRMKKLIFLVIAMCGMSFGFGEAWAATVTVNEASGTGVMTPTSLGASPGDTIIIAADRVTALWFDNFVGTAVAPYYFKNPSDAAVTITTARPGSSNTNAITFSDSAYVKLLGNNWSGTTYGINFDGTGAYTVASGIRFMCTTNWEVAYIYATQVGRIVSQNANNTDIGCSVSFDDVTPEPDLGDVSVHDCFGYYLVYEGVYLGKSLSGIYAQYSNVEIYNMIIEHSGWDGLQVAQTTGTIKIHDNDLNNVGTDTSVTNENEGIIINPEGQNAEICRNKLKTGTRNGIYLYTGTGGHNIHDNIISGFLRSGIKREGATGTCTMVNNTIVGSSLYGIAGGGAFTAYYNFLVANTSGGVQSTVTTQANNVTITAAQGIAAAKFTDPDNDDYSLLADSPAINVSNAAGYSTTDFLGIARPQPTGGYADAGAYERVWPQNQTPSTGIVQVYEDTSLDATVAVDGDIAGTSDPSDPDGDTLTYIWDVYDDGVTDATTQNLAAFTISGKSAGDTVPVKFTATDTGGLSSSTTVSIEVEGAGPTIEVTKVFGMNTGNDYAVGDDTMIDEAAPTTNYSSNPTWANNKFARAWEGTGVDRKILLSYDLTSYDITATAAKIRITKKSGPASGSQTITAYLCEDAFVASQATWNVYSTGNAWTGGDHGQTTQLGTVTVAASAAAGTAYDIDLTSLVGLNAATGSGVFYVVLTIGGSYFDTYTEEETAYEYAPELHITYSETTPVTPTLQGVYLVSPAAGTTLGIGGEILVRAVWDMPITYTVVGAGADPFSFATDEADLPLVIQSADGLTSNTHYFLGTVETGDVSSNLTLTANIVSTGDDTLKYGGAGGTEIDYVTPETALGVLIDTTAPDFSLGTFSHCDCDTGDEIAADTIYYTGEDFCTCVEESGSDELFHATASTGSLGIGLSFTLTGGDSTMGYHAGLDGSMAKIIFKYTVQAGDLATALVAASVTEDVGFIHGDTKIVNAAVQETEVSDYSLPQVTPSGGAIIIVGNGSPWTDNVDLSTLNGTAGSEIEWTDDITGNLTVGNYWDIKPDTAGRYLDVYGNITTGTNCNVSLVWMHSTLTPGQDSTVNMSVLDNVNITATGIVLRNCTIKGTLTVSESVRLINCIVDGTVTFGAAAKTLTAWCSDFSQLEATIEAAGSTGTVTDVDTTNQFLTDCDLTSNDVPTNPACSKCNRSDWE